MTSAFELEKKLEMLTDQVKDIFHATRLNIDALALQMHHKNTPTELQSILANCNSNIKELESLLEERNVLRLNYLITEQIKEEEAKVRRERLTDYEDKILDQRRLISDKETFYENLLRPKKKRPPHMSLEEFQDTRRREISEQENRKYNMLKDEVKKLDQFYYLLKKQNDKIENSLKSEVNKKEAMNDRFDISEELQNSQILYDSLSKELVSTEKAKEVKKIFEAIRETKQDNQNLMKEYLEEKEMEQYLRWERQKLVAQYKTSKEELSNYRQVNQKKPKVALFERSVSR